MKEQEALRRKGKREGVSQRRGTLGWKDAVLVGSIELCAEKQRSRMLSKKFVCSIATQRKPRLNILESSKGIDKLGI